MLSFLIKLGDHGLRVRLHIIFAAFAAKVEGSSLCGDLDRCPHIAQMVAAHRTDSLLECEFLFGSRQTLDLGNLGVCKLDRHAIDMGCVGLGALQGGRIGLLGIILRRGRVRPVPVAAADPAAAWSLDVSTLLTTLAGPPLPAVPAAGGRILHRHSRQFPVPAPAPTSDDSFPSSNLFRK